MGANSEEMYFSIKKLSSLNELSLWASCTIDENILARIFEHLQHIRSLLLRGNFSYFNLDSFVNLRYLSLVGTVINESFNVKLFKNLCQQLISLRIELTNIEDKKFFKLFDVHHFPILAGFSIKKCNIKRFRKEFIIKFPFLIMLFIIDCNLEVIERDVFSILKYLHCLDLSENRLKFIKKGTFSNLKNLKTLDLSNNELTKLDADFIGVRNSVETFFENNSLATFHRYWFSVYEIPIYFN